MNESRIYESVEKKLNMIAVKHNMDKHLSTLIKKENAPQKNEQHSLCFIIMIQK